MSESLSSVLILDKMKFKENDSSSSSMLGMIFFTIMLSITNYLSRQFTYFMDDVDLKKIINYELILHNFYKKNSLQYQGVISNTNSLYMGNVVQTCIFSDRFKALWEHIIKNTNETIHSLKEYTMDNKSDDAVYMVNQKDKFVISSEHEIYAYTYTVEDKLNDTKDSKMSSKTLTIVIELYSFKSSVDTMKNLVEKITQLYLSNLEKSRKMKKFIYTLTKTNYDEFTHERWSETVFESTRTFDNLFFDKKIETLAKINFFLKNRVWYFNKGIPYSLGIGLHGPPGTGKTSFIKALSNMTDRHIVTISLKLIKTKKQLDSIFFEQRYNLCNEKNSIGFDKKIIVFEDIDCIGDIVMSREFHVKKPVETKVLELKATDLVKLEPSEEPLTLDDLLNLWDGIRETPGRIMVLSSNHFDKLDPAIKRPGRIDISLELSYASKRIITEMYNHLFDDVIDNDMLTQIADEFYSPAEIVNIYMSEERSSTKFLSRMMQNKHV